jgi:chromate transporter
VSLGEMLAQLAIANLLTFGNGQIMVALLQQAFVQQAHALTNEQLLYAFSIARVTPGQANLFVPAIGYMLFGLPGAASSMLVIVAPAYLMIPLLRSFQVLGGNRRVLSMTRGLGSTAVGLLLASTWNLSKDSLNGLVAWAVFGIALVLMLFTRLPTVVSLLAAPCVGVILVAAGFSQVPPG